MNELIVLTNDNGNNTNTNSQEEEKEKKRKKPACTEDAFQFFMMYFKNRDNNELNSERINWKAGILG